MKRDYQAALMHIGCVASAHASPSGLGAKAVGGLEQFKADAVVHVTGMSDARLRETIRMPAANGRQPLAAVAAATPFGVCASSRTAGTFSNSPVFSTYGPDSGSECGGFSTSIVQTTTTIKYVAILNEVTPPPVST